MNTLGFILSVFVAICIISFVIYKESKKKKDNRLVKSDRYYKKRGGHIGKYCNEIKG